MEQWSLQRAKQLDEADALRAYREQFHLLPETIYLDGNSLGLMPKRAEQTLHTLIDSWRSLGIDGWMGGEHPWFYLSERCGELTAPLVGAKPHEVIVTGSTTTNLHQMIATFYEPSGQRTKIVADELNFPSDIYALQSQLQLKGYKVEEQLVRVASEDGRTLTEEAIVAAMTDDVALILLPSVLYRSGQILPMKRLTEEAHRRGIVIGFDLSHSIGAIEHELHDWGVDFAVWCSYKYLNGGPGAVGGLFVHERHFAKQPGLSGWFGSDKEKQFDMEHTFTKAQGVSAYQIATPHVLSIAPILGSLELFQEVGMKALRAKSLALTEFFMLGIEAELAEFHFTIGNPRSSEERGGHVFLEHEEAARICKALKQNGVVPDFRQPNGIRLAPVAFYNSFADVWQAVQVLKTIMLEKQYQQFENKREVIA